MNVLLTGATGLIGSVVLARLLERGHRVVATARCRAELSSAERIRRVLTALGIDGRDERLRVIEPSCGMELDSCLRGGALPDAVVHAAAAVKFDASPESMRSANVGTTVRLLESLDRVAPRAHFHFVSTAYVGGNRARRLQESMADPSGADRTPYEESKRVAEAAVLGSAARSSRAAAIHRPSIVAGDSQTGAAATFSGISMLLRILGMVSRPATCECGDAPAIVCDPAATKNIVPVDWVAGAIVALVEHEATGFFHLTHPLPLTHVDLAEKLHEAVDGLRIRLSRSAPPGPATAAQRALDRSLAPFAPYLRGEPLFDRSRLEAALGSAALPPLIDAEYLRRLRAYGDAVSWSERPFERAFSAQARGLPSAPTSPSWRDCPCAR